MNSNYFPDDWGNSNPYGKKPWDITPHEPYDKWVTKGKAIPKSITIADLFPNLDRWAIGWSPILTDLKSMATD